MAFPLAGIGAGLGLGVEALQRQQQQQMQAEQQRAYLQAQQRQQKLDEQRDQASAALFGAFAGGAGESKQPPALGLPGSTYAEPPGGSGMKSGLPSNPLDLIEKYESGGRNIMQQAVPPGGGYNPSVGRVTGPSTAQGPWQITNSTWKDAAPKAGVDIGQFPNAMAAPREVQKQVAQKLYDERGMSPWAPYNSNLRSAIARGEGGGGQMAPGGAATAGSRNAQQGGGINPQQIIQSAPPEMQHAGQQAAQSAASTIPQQLFGRLSIQSLAQAIDKANPSLPPAVKGMALIQAMPLLARDQGPELQIMMHMMTRQEQLADRAHTEGRQDARQATQDRTATDRQFEVYTDTDGTQYRLNPATGEARTLAGNETYTPKGAAKLGAAGAGTGQRVGKNIEVTDGEGKKIFSGSAHERRQPDGTTQWVADATGKPVEVPESGSLRIAGVGVPGRQVAAMNQRMLAGANQVAAALNNLSKMPGGATLGWFGGAQSKTPEGLMDGLRRSLANTVTPRDAQMMGTITRGMSRGLATLESVGSATGLVGLQKQMESAVPQQGDDGLVVLGKLADMRQIMDRAVEVVDANPEIGKEQRDLIHKMRDEAHKAVPYTVEDVIALSSDPSEQTISQFAQKLGLGNQAGAPKQGDVQDGYRFKGGNPADQSAWEKVQ